MTLKRVCSLQTRSECWTYDGQILLTNWQVAFLGRENKLPYISESNELQPS